MECVLLPENVEILGNATSDDSNLDCDAVAFFRFIKRLRKEKSSSSLSFEGKFEQGSELESVPSSLLDVVSTILYGCCRTNIGKATQPAVTIGQLIKC